MPHSTHIDRQTASKLNPLISCISIGDTLDQVAAVVSDLGYLLSEIDSARKSDTRENSFGSLYLICNVIASAAQYESDNHTAEHAAQLQVVAA